MSRRPRGGLLSCGLAIVIIVLVSSVSAQTGRPEPPSRPIRPANQPQRGLVYDGLEPADSGPCAGMYEIADTGMCTHGPDPLPAGRSRFAPAPLVAGPAANQPQDIVCDGDGKLGRRVQVLYVRAADAPDRYSAMLPSIKQWAAEMDQLVLASAQETGGSRRIRFVTDAVAGGCAVSVLNVVVPAGATAELWPSIRVVRELGHTRTDRKYVMFTEAAVFCGIAGMSGDDSAALTNYANDGPFYARIDQPCWAAHIALHELGHNIGAVAPSAPNATISGHCTDESDVMCYSDEPEFPEMRQLCPFERETLLDCNHDDYFHTDPPPGSYLATHWNTANSGFLVGAPVAQPSPPSGLQLRFTSRNSAIVSWEDSHEEAFYTLSRPAISGAAGPITLAANVTTFEDTTLLCGKHYTYEVSASGLRGASNPARVDTYAMTMPSCDVADAYEPDNSAAAARPIAAGDRQVRNMYPAGDSDWARFNLAEDSQVILQAANLGWSSNLELVDGAGKVIDTPRLPTDPAVIWRSCQHNPLPAGTHYARVHSPDGLATSADYALSASIVACADLRWSYLPLISR